MTSDPLFDGLFGDLLEAGNPTVPISQAVGGSEQVIDDAGISRHSRVSHAENRGLTISDPNGPELHDFRPAGSRVASYHVSDVGSAGNVGTELKTLAASDTWLFPLPSLLVGKEEEKREMPDLPAGCTPITPATIRAAVQREMRALAEDGREGPDALRDAVAIVAAKIRNSEALAERQASGAACHACDERLDDTAPVVAVLTGRRGSHLYLHAGCCEAFGARRADLVSRVMASAGYGADPSGAAA